MSVGCCGRNERKNGECFQDQRLVARDLRLCTPTLGGRIACRWRILAMGPFKGFALMSSATPCSFEVQGHAIAVTGFDACRDARAHPQVID